MTIKLPVLLALFWGILTLTLNTVLAEAADGVMADAEIAKWASIVKAERQAVHDEYQGVTIEMRVTESVSSDQKDVAEKKTVKRIKLYLQREQLFRLDEEILESDDASQIGIIDSLYNGDPGCVRIRYKHRDADPVIAGISVSGIGHLNSRWYYKPQLQFYIYDNDAFPFYPGSAIKASGYSIEKFKVVVKGETLGDSKKGVAIHGVHESGQERMEFSLSMDPNLHYVFTGGSMLHTHKDGALIEIYDETASFEYDFEKFGLVPSRAEIVTVQRNRRIIRTNILETLSVDHSPIPASVFVPPIEMAGQSSGSPWWRRLVLLGFGFLLFLMYWVFKRNPQGK
ncbi:hypothetical protein CA13_11460 [Planctomycetes bacterium CA13]|uniref:Uncharacterized protein n=1 Tax=Novipirellula herctigrandis TaxID=2527986 RepID=A0A5C5YXF0_9BACT|nr:hypothetical protein CA13_11460 [Planctomycetes bacterium CA13]